MARSKWTVMLVPHDNERVRSVQLSSSTVQALLSGALIIALVGGLLTAGLFVRQSQSMRAEQLERENLLLAAEVTDMRSEMEALQNSIDRLAEMDEEYRTIAGLPPINDDVQRVGIGGPGTPSVESFDIYQENSELGEQIFAANYDLETL